MGRPTSKSALLLQGKTNYEKLFAFINTLSENEQNDEFPPGTLNRNVRDILMHLHHWHGMMLLWYETGMSGEKPEMPAPGYTWKTTPELNQWIQQEYNQVPLEEAKAQLKDSFTKVRALIERHSQEELFEKKHYKWTGTTSLGAYLISATSSHYDWALKLIKRERRQMKA